MGSSPFLPTCASGQEGAAQRFYQVGYQLACEADPNGRAAWMMRAPAHQALSLKQPTTASS